MGGHSKKRAKACRDLGEPEFIHAPGTRVVIRSGSRKGTQQYFVLEGKYRRRVVREKGKITQALHVKYYRLQPVDNPRKVLWPWPSESKLKVVRV
jgi:hypothetical protein